MLLRGLVNTITSPPVNLFGIARIAAVGWWVRGDSLDRAALWMIMKTASFTKRFSTFV